MKVEAGVRVEVRAYSVWGRGTGLGMEYVARRSSNRHVLFVTFWRGP